ncbi:AAA family ATPase [Aurantimonas endophytica]|uniref:Putative ATP-dependent endonuclease of OLD family n=1 Tax=Aurantimonas endophytica TaxID=1522175 RepID=A0A7W6HHV9_9HYPH|nr:putative ATP-dependent endonuclease of OLD family [Aurantimonas endophytica]MCO6405877.1 AAA family ATPase [Aurantimonas endophytica]
MKLIEAHATNYRNIIDANPIAVGQTTCLVGKNEAGKSAFLKALEGLRSTDPTFIQYGKITNYPRRSLAEYDSDNPDGEARVMRTVWQLEPKDREAVAAVLGSDALTGDTIVVQKSYEQANSTWTLSLNQKQVLENLIAAYELTAEDRAVIGDAYTTQKAAEALASLGTRTTAQQTLLDAITKFRSKSAYYQAIDLLDARMPKFMYFSHYDRMSGELSINKLDTDRQNSKETSSGDRVFLDFLEYAGTTLDDLVKTTQFEELNAKCEAAALRITDQIFDYWTQNDELKIKVVLSEGKPGDPAPFNSGPVARARVENSLHGVTVPFSERSAGFIWFFSFLVKFAQIKKSHGNVILLLDEPGLTLHGTAQLDLLRYFYREIAPHHQLIWSTHSPFMVPADDLASVRTVEDVVTSDQRGRKKSIGTKIRADVLTTDPQTNFPIFGAMGFEVTQTLIIGKNTLLVEGPSDILYLQAVSSALKAAGRTHLSPQWAICPSGGIDKVLPFVRLFYGNKLNTVVLTDFERGQKKKLEDLHRAALLDSERIILATEIAGKDEADIEDFFEPALFVDLVNKTYSLKDGHELTVEKLNAADPSTGRLVKKAEAYFRILPAEIPEFSHFDPSMYLLQHPRSLTAKERELKTHWHVLRRPLNASLNSFDLNKRQLRKWAVSRV